MHHRYNPYDSKGFPKELPWEHPLDNMDSVLSKLTLVLKELEGGYYEVKSQRCIELAKQLRRVLSNPEFKDKSKGE